MGDRRSHSLIVQSREPERKVSLIGDIIRLTTLQVKVEGGVLSFGVGNPSAPHSLYDIAVLYSGLMLTGYIHVYVYSLSLSHPRSYHKMLISHLNSICSHVCYLKSLTPYETLGREVDTSLPFSVSRKIAKKFIVMKREVPDSVCNGNTPSACSNIIMVHHDQDFNQCY